MTSSTPPCQNSNVVEHDVVEHDVVEHDVGNMDTEPTDDNSNQREPTARFLHVNTKKCTNSLYLI